MAVYLVQHGVAMPKEENPDRPLTEEGQKTTKLISERARDYHTKVEKIYHTEKLRAIQTAEILEYYCQPEEGRSETDGMGAKDDVKQFSARIDKNRNDMFVGHLPFMEKLASYMVSGNENNAVFKFQNSGIIKLEYSEDDGWQITGAFLPKPV